MIRITLFSAILTIATGVNAALNSNCNDLPQALSRCSGYTCSFKSETHPSFKQITGILTNNTCRYVEHQRDNKTVCNFPIGILKELSDKYIPNMEGASVEDIVNFDDYLKIYCTTQSLTSGRKLQDYHTNLDTIANNLDIQLINGELPSLLLSTNELRNINAAILERQYGSHPKEYYVHTPETDRGQPG